MSIELALGVNKISSIAIDEYKIIYNVLVV